MRARGFIRDRSALSSTSRPDGAETSSGCPSHLPLKPVGTGQNAPAFLIPPLGFLLAMTAWVHCGTCAAVLSEQRSMIDQVFSFESYPSYPRRYCTSVLAEGAG